VVIVRCDYPQQSSEDRTNWSAIPDYNLISRIDSPSNLVAVRSKLIAESGVSAYVNESSALEVPCEIEAAQGIESPLGWVIKQHRVL